MGEKFPLVDDTITAGLSAFYINGDIAGTNFMVGIIQFENTTEFLSSDITAEWRDKKLFVFR